LSLSLQILAEVDACTSAEECCCRGLISVRERERGREKRREGGKEGGREGGRESGSGLIV